MKQRYLDYASYNIWANNKLIDCLLEQDEKLLSTEFVGSFPTIRATLLHIWLAEVGWLSRLEGKAWDASEVKSFVGTSAELFKAWQSASLAFKDFVETNDLEVAIPFDHKGKSFTIPSREIAQTVFNHGTYHRGQVVMMLRQLGVSVIPQTDYIAWVRENALA